MLALRDITRAPQFTKPRKHEIDGIRAENREHNREERRVHAYGFQLYAPAHGSEHMGKYAQHKSHHDPPVVAFRPDNADHLPHILLGKQYIAEQNRDNQRHHDLENQRPHRTATRLHVAALWLFPS